jgi:hypothetical protein
MDSVVGRLLLRVLLVPLGYFFAVLAGTLVIVIATWNLGRPPAGEESFALMAIALAAPFLLLHLLHVMWLPAAIGVLVAEMFAVRAWIFHAGNGAVSAWLAWRLLGEADSGPILIERPATVIATGLAGGLAYWLIAGRSAGLWPPAVAPGPSIR